MDDDFKNNFFEKLRAKNVSDEFIDSLDELIKSNKFSSDNLNDLIEGEFDERN